MRNAIDKGIDNSRGFFNKAQDRARDLSERGVLRFEIMQLESRVEKLTAKLGARAYEVLSKEKQNTISKNTPGVKDLISEIEDIEKRVHEKEADLAALAERAEEQGEPEGAAPGSTAPGSGGEAAQGPAADKKAGGAAGKGSADQGAADGTDSGSGKADRARNVSPKQQSETSPDSEEKS
jgi:hypothetical protein